MTTGLIAVGPSKANWIWQLMGQSYLWPILLITKGGICPSINVTPLPWVHRDKDHWLSCSNCSRPIWNQLVHGQKRQLMTKVTCDQSSLQVREAWMSLLTWNQDQTSWKIITSKKPSSQAQRLFYKSLKDQWQNPKLLVCPFLKVANLILAQLLDTFYPFSAKPSVIAVL